MADDHRNVSPRGLVAEGQDPTADDGNDEDLRLARRALLKASLYVPPAIIGTLMISRDAAAQTEPSCMPLSCQPGPPCGPVACKPDACAPSGCSPEQCNPAPVCEPANCSPATCQPGT